MAAKSKVSLTRFKMRLVNAFSSPLAIFVQRHVLCKNGRAMKIPHLVFNLLMLTLSLSAFSQKPGTVFPSGEVGVDYNLRDSKGKKEGPWIRVYQEQPSVLYYRGRFKSGIPQGIFEFYAKDGSLLSTVNHVKDSTINDVVFFQPDSKTIKSQGRYTGSVVEGKWVRVKQGNWKTYDPSGMVRSDENYINDFLDGSCKYYYSNGKMVAIYAYVKGKFNGPFSTYYENGKKEKEGFYLNDEFEGDYKSWKENGTLESEGKYLAGLKDGNWNFYATSGMPEVTVLFKKGTEVKRRYENGTFSEYYDNGIPKSEYSYENGMKNGPFNEWFDQGQFVQVPGTPEDVKQGIAFREKLEGTQLRVSGDYVDDHYEGEITFYTPKGRIEKIEVWQNGELITTKAAGN